MIRDSADDDALRLAELRAKQRQPDAYFVAKSEAGALTPDPYSQREVKEIRCAYWPRCDRIFEVIRERRGYRQRPGRKRVYCRKHSAPKYAMRRKRGDWRP